MPPVPRADLARVYRDTVAGLSDDLSSESARNALRRYIDRTVIPAVGLRKAIGNPALWGLNRAAWLVAGARNHLNLEFSWAAA